MNPERHDMEVAAHLQREEKAQAERCALTKQAINNLTARYWSEFTSGGDGWGFFCDEITTATPMERVYMSCAHLTGDLCELGRTCAQIHERALAAYIDRFEAAELDRLRN